MSSPAAAAADDDDDCDIVCLDSAPTPSVLAEKPCPW
jgi:hypothetical protein